MGGRGAQRAQGSGQSERSSKEPAPLGLRAGDGPGQRTWGKLSLGGLSAPCPAVGQVCACLAETKLKALDLGKVTGVPSSGSSRTSCLCSGAGVGVGGGAALGTRRDAHSMGTTGASGRAGRMLPPPSPGLGPTTAGAACAAWHLGVRWSGRGPGSRLQRSRWKGAGRRVGTQAVCCRDTHTPGGELARRQLGGAGPQLRSGCGPTAGSCLTHSRRMDVLRAWLKSTGWAPGTGFLVVGMT